MKLSLPSLLGVSDDDMRSLVAELRGLFARLERVEGKLDLLLDAQGLTAGEPEPPAEGAD